MRQVHGRCSSANHVSIPPGDVALLLRGIQDCRATQPFDHRLRRIKGWRGEANLRPTRRRNRNQRLTRSGAGIGGIGRSGVRADHSGVALPRPGTGSSRCWVLEGSSRSQPSDGRRDDHIPSHGIGMSASRCAVDGRRSRQRRGCCSGGPIPCVWVGIVCSDR